MSETTDVVQASPIIRSVVKPGEMKIAVLEYQQLVTDLLNDNDTVEIKGKRFIRKSGWYKLAVPFNISTEIVEEKSEKLNPEGTQFAYHFTVRAKVGDTRHIEEIGSCDNTSKDKFNESRHVVRSMAKTRATSRAIASMIGASEQSAEDMEAVKSLNISSDDTTTDNKAVTDTREPSEAQMKLLGTLGYKGAKPMSMSGACLLIKQLKEGASTT